MTLQISIESHFEYDEIIRIEFQALVMNILNYLFMQKQDKIDSSI